MLTRITTLLGVSLMFCVGQQGERNLLAVDKKMVEVGLPLQVSVQPISVYDLETSGLWVQNGRYLVYALQETERSDKFSSEGVYIQIYRFVSRLYIYDTKSGRSKVVTPNPVVAYQCDSQGVFLVVEKAVSEDHREAILSVLFFDPASGRIQVLFETPFTIRTDIHKVHSPDGRYLVFQFSLHSVVIDRNTRQVVRTFSGEFDPYSFLDNTQLLGWGYLSPEERQRHGLVIHIPTGQLRKATKEEIDASTQSILAGTLPQSIQQATLPERSKNLEAVKEEGALYLLSRTGKGDKYRAVLLTYDAIDFVLGPDFIPAIEENQVVDLVPNPRRLAALIAPDESGVAYVNLHNQLFYIPLTHRDPKDLTEMLACGIEPTSEAVMENYMNNAKQIGLALIMYAQDYDEHFPIAGDVQDMIMPYVRNPSIFTDPRTGQNIFTYLLNGEHLGAIDNPAQKRIGFLDWGDPNWIIVIFADGHVKRVPRGQ